MAKNDGGSAFPKQPIVRGANNVGDLVIEQSGMTLRQWYAGLAMHGLLASPRAPGTNASPHVVTAKEVAELAFVVADEMIAEGAK